MTTIREYLDTIAGVYPFHMPGHKRNAAFAGEYRTADITEIEGADNLLAPTGILKGLEDKLKRLYGARASFMLVNGSTVGIESALLYCGPRRLIMARNSHRSAYSGLILSGAQASYVRPEIDETGIARAITPTAVETALDAYPDAAALFITSPTFEGCCSDLAEISRLVHARGVLLIVDEAHGAHFGFHPAFPKSAVQSGADIVIQSLHKTLPVPGQCSVMHVSGERVDIKRLKHCVNILQTSSPSYFFMAEAERCADLLLSDADRLFSEYYGRLLRFRAGLKTEGIRLIKTDDPGKLVFYMQNAMNGAVFMSRLRENKVELEMCALRHAVAMTSIADTDAGFARLLAAVHAAERGAGPADAPDIPTEPYPDAAQALSMREAFFSEKRTVALEEAENATAGDFIIPYPPGIPLIAPGEVITGEIIDRINRLSENGISVLGASEVTVTA